MRHRFSVVPVAIAAGLSSLALFVACGGGGKNSSTTTDNAPQGAMDVIVSDAPSAAWSSVDVVIQKIALRPVGGGTPVVVFDQTGASSPVHMNLVDLDELGELLTGASVPVGTYDKVYVQIDPASVSLSDTAATPQTFTVAGGNVKVVGLSGFDVSLSAPLTVTKASTNAVELDFDLGHPLFIVDRPGGAPSGANGTTMYLVNFERCVRHRPHLGMASFLLRHMRGSVASATVSSLTVNTEHKGSKTLSVDAANGTLFYDLDAAPVVPVTSTTVPSGLTSGKFVRVAARYQGSGGLTAVRVWYTTDESKLRRFSPEGHVVSVDTTNDTLDVIWSPTAGGPLQLTTVTVDSGTNFFFHGGAPIGTGASFLTHVQPGFKVQMTVADPSAASLLATNVDIERAAYEGDLGLASGNTGLTYANPRYGASSPLSASFASPFAWWNFTYPTLANTTSSGLVTLLSGLGATPAKGISTLTWNGTSNAWDANTCVLLPIVQKGDITTSLSGSTFGFTPTGGSAESVSVSSTLGSATLVYQVQIQSGIVTVSPVDSAMWPSALVSGAHARLFAVPTAAGLQSYVVILLPASF
jgi:hypothetical protein